MEFGLLSTFFVWVFAAYDGRLKMRERKMRHNVAGLEIAENVLWSMESQRNCLEC